jgi:hypothetical protein
MRGPLYWQSAWKKYRYTTIDRHTAPWWLRKIAAVQESVALDANSARKIHINVGQNTKALISVIAW